MSVSFIRGENPLSADKLNTAFGERVLRSGDTMGGLLTLASDPVSAFDAATKQYVDSRYTQVGPPGPPGPTGSALDFASPPPMGSTTPNTGAFTTLNTTGAASFGSTVAAIGPLTLGAGGAGSAAIIQSGTGNFTFTLGGSASILNFRSSALASILQIGGTANNITPRKPIVLTGPYAITGAPQSDAALYMNQTWTGSAAIAQSAQIFLQSVENVSVSGDGSLSGLYVKMTGSGAGILGNRQAGFLQYVLSSVPTDVGTGAAYNALNIKTDIMVGAGGTALDMVNTLGTTFGFNPVVHLGPLCKFWRGAICTEFDVWNEPGSSVMDRVGLAVVLIDNSTGTVARNNIALTFNNQGIEGATSNGWKTLIALGKEGGHIPLASDGIIMRYIKHDVGIASPTIGGGIDLTGLTISGNAFASPGFAVNGAGNVNVVAAIITNAAGTNRPLRWQTAALDRFTAQVNTNAETGVSNAGSNLDWLSHNDAGTSLGVFLRIARATGAWTFDPNNAFTTATITNPWVLNQNNTFTQRANTTFVAGTGIGFGGANPAAIWQDKAWSGTLDTGASPASINYIRMRDAIASPSIAMMPMLIDHQLNAGYDGTRFTLQLKTNKNAPSLTGSNFVQLACFYSAFAGEGGTAGTPVGYHTTLNVDCQIATNAYESLVSCQENDLRLQAGSHADIKTNLKIHWGIGDAVHGTLEDSGLSIHKAGTIAPGTGGGLTMIGIGQVNQDWPLDPNATNTSIMQIRPNTFGNLSYAWRPIATYGFDLTLASFSGYAWRSSGFWIDGAGQLPVLGPAAVTHSTTGTKISVPNVREVSAVVASGGGGYKVTDIICDAIGGLWNVATVAGGNAVATVTLRQTGYANPAPANPVATTGGAGTGCTLTVTTAATGALTLADTGQSLGFYGATAVAKQTGVAVTVAAIHSALTNLGLIAP